MTTSENFRLRNESWDKNHVINFGAICLNTLLWKWLRNNLQKNKYLGTAVKKIYICQHISRCVEEMEERVPVYCSWFPIWGFARCTVCSNSVDCILLISCCKKPNLQIFKTKSPDCFFYQISTKKLHLQIFLPNLQSFKTKSPDFVYHISIFFNKYPDYLIQICCFIFNESRQVCIIGDSVVRQGLKQPGLLQVRFRRRPSCPPLSSSGTVERGGKGTAGAHRGVLVKIKNEKLQK